MIITLLHIPRQFLLAEEEGKMSGIWYKGDKVRVYLLKNVRQLENVTPLQRYSEDYGGINNKNKQ